jgi:hypothetical protein
MNLGKFWHGAKAPCHLATRQISGVGALRAPTYAGLKNADFSGVLTMALLK